MRDGSLQPAQLRHGKLTKLRYRDAVQILDADLGKLLAADILAAIAQHVATLPPKQRSQAPQPTAPRAVFKPKAKPEVLLSAGKTANGAKPLPPPVRLMAGRKGIERVMANLKQIETSPSLLQQRRKPFR